MYSAMCSTITCEPCEINPIFVAWSKWEYSYSLLDGILIQGYPQQYVAGTHLYTWEERDNVR